MDDDGDDDAKRLTNEGRLGYKDDGLTSNTLIIR